MDEIQSIFTQLIIGFFFFLILAADNQNFQQREIKYCYLLFPINNIFAQR